jgi:peptidyl-tRNA hydrolase, PTH1 family
VRVKLIVGLGNPGSEYQETRHNLGYRVVEVLARQHRILLEERTEKAVYGQGSIQEEKVVLSKPLTFMNRSGVAVRELCQIFQLSPADLIVIHDDIDLALGRLRIKTRGGHGGHNGLKSILAILGTDRFVRIKLGVGRPKKEEATDHVLGPFMSKERLLVQEMIGHAVAAAELVVRGGIAQAMNQFH